MGGAVGVGCGGDRRRGRDWLSDSNRIDREVVVRVAADVSQRGARLDLRCRRGARVASKRSVAARRRRSGRRCWSDRVGESGAAHRGRRADVVRGFVPGRLRQGNNARGRSAGGGDVPCVCAPCWCAGVAGAATCSAARTGVCGRWGIRGISAVAGYVLGVDRSDLGGHLVYVGMALHTGIGIALLGAAAVCVRPNVGFTAQLLDGGISGGVSRRVTLMVALAPALLLVAGVSLARVLPTEALSQSVFSVVQVAVLSAAVLIPSAVIARTERQLRDELDTARRRDEHRGDVDTLVEAVTAEMTITAPNLPGWEIAMRYQPATGHLAGDSVQVHVRQHPRPATLLALVDVAGHDVYSAVVAYGLRAHIGALWETGADLCTVASSANAKLLRRDTIATAVLVVVEPGGESVDVVNAGHPAPVHIRSGHQAHWYPTGPLLGLPHATYDVREFDILPGDLVVFYTDGVIEARSPDGHQLGEEFIHRLIAARQTEPAATIADACVNAAVEHARSRLPRRRARHRCPAAERRSSLTPGVALTATGDSAGSHPV